MVLAPQSIKWDLLSKEKKTIFIFNERAKGKKSQQQLLAHISISRRKKKNGGMKGFRDPSFQTYRKKWQPLEAMMGREK